jgi:acyl transferase domain-containing protein
MTAMETLNADVSPMPSSAQSSIFFTSPSDTDATSLGSADHHDASSVPEPLAIVGMAMRLPGKVRNGADFWKLLTEKRSGLCDVPKDRFNIEAFHDPDEKPGTLRMNKGYYLEDVNIQQFDTSFFSLSKAELERLDPQQRQLLEVTYECMEDAGATNWRGANIGCYVGVFAMDWQDLHGKETQHRGGYRATGFEDFVLANRISYEYDLRGPR